MHLVFQFMYFYMLFCSRTFDQISYPLRTQNILSFLSHDFLQSMDSKKQSSYFGIYLDCIFFFHEYHKIIIIISFLIQQHILNHVQDIIFSEIYFSMSSIILLCLLFFFFFGLGKFTHDFPIVNLCIIQVIHTLSSFPRLLHLKQKNPLPPKILPLHTHTLSTLQITTTQPISVSLLFDVIILFECSLICLT